MSIRVRQLGDDPYLGAVVIGAARSVPEDPEARREIGHAFGRPDFTGRGDIGESSLRSIATA